MGSRTSDPLGLRVTIEEVIDSEHAARFHEVYVAAFGPLRTLAAARQVLHPDEFMAEMSDARVLKYVVWDEDGTPSAMATITRHLEVIPWISPEYFRQRFPGHAARNAIYYLGFALVHPAHRREGLLEQLVVAGVAPLIENRAVCAFDVCAFNDSTLGLAGHIETIFANHAACEMTRLDSQSYYAVTFGGA